MHQPAPRSASDPARLAAVEQLLARGWRPTRVVERAMADWGVSERLAWELVARVRDRWATEASVTREAARAALLAQLLEALAAAWEAGDLREVRGVLTLLADVHGLRQRPQGAPSEAALSEPEREALMVALSQRPAASSS